MINRTLLTGVTAIVSLAFGYFLSYQVHGKCTEEGMDRLVEEFYNENYGYTVANDTYKLAILFSNIKSNNVTQSDKEHLKEIIQFNMGLMETSLKGGAKWDSITIERYQEVKEMLNGNSTKP